MITMTEIAKLTHVSQPTVSRVLNGNRSVDPEIRERVLACAREHDYQFNALAQSLQGSKTMLLGVLVTNISNSFFADLAKAVELEARKHGYSIILLNSDYDSEKEQSYLDVLRRYRVDGVFAVPVLRDNGYWPDCAKRLDVPLVVVTRRVEGLDSIYLDHAGASGLVARHMLERGFERFLFIGRDYDVKYQGFRRTLLEARPEADVRRIEYWDDRRLLADLGACFQESGARTGVYANNDICALRVLWALRELGVPVPERAGVAGFDDTFMGRYLNPALTSVTQPIGEMAREAVERLMDRIAHPGPREPLDRAVRAALAVRESC